MQLRIKKNKKVKYGILLLVIVSLANFTPLHQIFNLIADSNHYRYSSATGNFTFTEEMGGRDTAMLYRWFDAYKAEKKDTVLYRLFYKNPLAFWRYKSYLTDLKYKLPYKSWSKINLVRKDTKYLGKWQNF